MKIEDHKFSSDGIRKGSSCTNERIWLDTNDIGGFSMNKADAIAIADHFGVLKEQPKLTDTNFRFSDGESYAVALNENDLVFRHPTIDMSLNKDDIKAMARHFGIIE